MGQKGILKKEKQEETNYTPNFWFQILSAIQNIK
jgi:hypothetical protein